MVLMCGSERWVMVGSMLTVLEGFNPWVSRRIVGKKDWRAGDSGWEWPPVEETLEVTEL